MHSIVALVEPAVGEVELEHLWLIDESVLVHVVGDDVARDVAKDNRAPFVAHLQRGCDIEVHLGVAHYHSVDEEGLFVGRLSVLQVYLTCHRFHSIDD